MKFVNILVAGFIGYHLTKRLMMEEFVDWYKNYYKIGFSLDVEEYERDYKYER